MEKIIAPSLLAADQARFGEGAERAGRSGADWLHLDIMDGHFVPNISFGPQVVNAVRPLTKLFFDIHLMCSQPEVLIEAFAKAGADEMIIHVELGRQIPSLIQKIKALGKKVGLAVNPPTAIASVQPYLEQIDLLLVMTVNPGFGDRNSSAKVCRRFSRRQPGGGKRRCPTASASMAALTTRPVPTVPVPARILLWRARVCSVSAT